MTEYLDPYEIMTEDSDGDWELGPVCSIEDDECESCS